MGFLTQAPSSSSRLSAVPGHPARTLGSRVGSSGHLHQFPHRWGRRGPERWPFSQDTASVWQSPALSPGPGILVPRPPTFFLFYHPTPAPIPCGRQSHVLTSGCKRGYTPSAMPPAHARPRWAPLKPSEPLPWMDGKDVLFPLSCTPQGFCPKQVNNLEGGGCRNSCAQPALLSG